MSTSRDTKIFEAILFASGTPILEDDLKDKMIIILPLFHIGVPTTDY